MYGRESASMKKKVFILNHYAGGTLFNKGGRHYWIAKFLKRAGYEPVLFVSNSKNGVKERHVQTDKLWTEMVADEIGTPYVFIKTKLYSNNGKERIINMVDYYRNVITSAKQYAKLHGAPDIIYASSVHPLALTAGIKLAKYFGVRCICEVRDLWPESLVAYGHLKRGSAVAKALYRFEKNIYMKADRIVMTWPGGYDYIRDRGWDGDIPSEKVVHISNGVDLEEYKNNIEAHPYTDEALEDASVKKIIYTGSVREVNNLGLIVEAARILRDRGVEGFRILVYGDGSEREKLAKDAEDAGLTNISFMGKVPKECVPAVLTHAYVTLLHNSSTELDKYGQSQNKFFEYLAAGKPILMTYSVGHSVCRENNCGFEIEKQSPESIADAIEKIVGMSDAEYDSCSKNAEKTAEKYDFRNLTKVLINVIESL